MLKELQIAFEENDQETIQKFANNFKLMDRAIIFSDLYVARLIDPLKESWKKVSSKITDTNQVSVFFSNIVGTCEKESSLQRGHLDGYDHVPKFISALLQDLDPSFNALLDNLGTANFPIIVELFTKSRTFTADLEQFALSEDIYDIIFKPFLKFFQKYSQFEEAYLNILLNSYLGSKSAPILRETTYLINIANLLLSRCKTFTFGNGSALAQLVLANYFSSVINEFKHEIESLPEIVTINDRNTSEYSMVMINLSEADWMQFQSRLSYFEDIVNFFLELTKFQKELHIGKVKNIDHVSKSVKKEIDSMIQTPDSDSILLQVKNAEIFCEKCQRDVLETLLVHIKPHVDSISKHNWTSNASSSEIDLPQFSQSPLTYITAIGEYLVLFFLLIF